jgi:hypothetical protein
MKSGKTLPSNYIIGVVLFTMLIVGGVSMIAEFTAKDSSFIEGEQFSDFNKSFNKLTNVNESIANLETGITEADPDVGVFGVLNALIQSSWNSLKLIFNSFGFMEDVFSSTSTVFGVPSWVGLLVGLLATVVLVFGIWGAIFQRDL